MRRTERQTSGQERKEERMVKAEVLRNANRIRTELFRPAYLQPGRPGPQGTERMGRGWVREGGEERGEIL